MVCTGTGPATLAIPLTTSCSNPSSHPYHYMLDLEVTANTDILMPYPPSHQNAQMDYYTESAKSLSKASQQLRVDQELINIMPTVANTGANPHPKANSSQGSYDGTWDAAEAVRPASKARGRGGRVEQQGVHRHGSSGPAAAEMEALQERRLADGDIDIG